MGHRFDKTKNTRNGEPELSSKDALSEIGVVYIYVKPYVDRVVRQQSERIRREAKKNGTDSGSQGGNNQGVGGTSTGNGGLGTARPIRGVEDDGRSVAGPESSGGGIAQPPRTQQVGGPSESTVQGNQPQNPPSQTPTVKPNPPTKTQADQGKVQAKAVLEIGKPGTPFENGIQNFDTIAFKRRSLEVIQWVCRPASYWGVS